VEKVVGYVGRSHECRMLAAITDSVDLKAEYMRLAELWLDLAEERQELLKAAGIDKPH
jgi:hypothetical protein